MKRRLFALAAGVSLLLCLATAGLWVRSCFVYDRIGCTHAVVYSLTGRLFCMWGDFSTASHGWMRESAFSDIGSSMRSWFATNALNPWWEQIGFGLDRFDHASVLRVPHWFLALLFAILPAVHLFATIRRRHIRRKRLCPVCGYDLRATPERCPECGTVVGDGRR